MRPDTGRTVLAAAVLLGALGLPACASTRSASAPATDAERAQVRQALQVFNDAAARGDVPGLMAQFDPDAQVLLVGSDRGEIFQGRAAIEAWLTRLLAKNRFSWQMDRVDVDLNGDTAWAFVDATVTIRAPDGKVRFTGPYRFAAVLVRRGDAWAWRMFHGSVPRGE